MLTSERSIGEEARKELARRIAKISPAAAKKAVWFERAVIVRTDSLEIAHMREALGISAGGVELRPALTSGSIGKLKKAVPG